MSWTAEEQALVAGLIEKVARLTKRLAAQEAMEIAGSGSSYTDEQAQDAVGGILTDSTTVDFTYNDAGPSITATVPNDSIAFAKMQNINTDSLIGRDTAGSGDPETITLGASLEMDGSLHLQRAALTGDVTAPANSNTTTIANNAVTDAKLRDSAALSVIGRGANSSGDPADISATATSGAVLRESGSAIGFGTVATAGLANDAVDNTKLANMGNSTIKGRTTAGTGDPEDLTASQAAAIVQGSITSLSSPTITTPTITVNDNAFTLQDEADNTKKVQFQLSAITTGQTRTLFLPDQTDTLVGRTISQTLVAKTLTTPTIGDFTNATHAHDSAAHGGQFSDLTITGRLTAPTGTRSYAVNILDDGVDDHAFTGQGLIMVTTLSNGVNTNRYLFGVFRANSGPVMVALNIGTDFNVSTGTLTGTAGTDGKVTISATNGHIYIENRIGATMQFTVTLYS